MSAREHEWARIKIGSASASHTAESAARWEGICVEPNPSMEPYFRAHRTCRHMRNCAWSKRKKVLEIRTW